MSNAGTIKNTVRRGKKQAALKNLKNAAETPTLSVSSALVASDGRHQTERWQDAYDWLSGQDTVLIEQLVELGISLPLYADLINRILLTMEGLHVASETTEPHQWPLRALEAGMMMSLLLHEPISRLGEDVRHRALLVVQNAAMQAIAGMIDQPDELEVAPDNAEVAVDLAAEQLPV